MPTNQEWLNQLATESPDKLKAWFDAEHTDDNTNARAQFEALMLEKLELQQQVDELQERVMEKHYELKDANAANKRQSEKIEGVCRLNDELQHKVDELTDSYEASSRALDILTLDKAELQTQLKSICTHLAIEAEGKPDILASLAIASIDALISERDNLAADLLACNREREQLRKHLGIALDHAHDICSLVDIDGNVLDVGD